MATLPVPVAVGVPAGLAVLGLVVALVALAVLEALVALVAPVAVPVAGRGRADSAVLHVGQSAVVVVTKTSCSHSI